MTLEDRAGGLELADAVMAERSWNEWQLIAYTAAHRGLAFDGGEAPERSGAPDAFISGSVLGNFPFRSSSYTIRDEN
jgi:hypothetical protein